MNQFDQQLLATIFLSEGPKLRENPAMIAVTRVATAFVLLAGSGLLAIATVNRFDPNYNGDLAGRMVLPSGPSAQYLQALATSEAADAEEAGQSGEASAR